MILNPTTTDEIKANREEWITELESGKWKQCTGKYRDGDRRCADGVLLELAGRTSEGFREDICTAYIAVGLRFNENRIVSANDNGKTFDQIAKLIRSLPLMVTA